MAGPDITEDEVRTEWRAWLESHQADVAVSIDPATGDIPPIDLIKFGWEAGYRTGVINTYDEDEAY